MKVKDTRLPLVSIIIPVYNGGNYLKDAINSALAQDYEHFEVIVVNDGSKDDWITENICRSYGDKIRYFQKENWGVGSALNFWVRKAKGNYISWLSHDDIYLSNKISEQIRYLQKWKFSKETIFSTDVETINSAGVRINSLSLDYEEENFIYELLMRGVINWCTLLIPISAFSDVGWFDETLRTTQDYQLWFRFIKAGYKFSHIPKVLVRSRTHTEQDSVTKKYLAEQERKNLEKFVFSLFSGEEFVRWSKSKRNPRMLLWEMKIILFLKRFIPTISTWLKKIGIYDLIAPLYLKHVLKK